MSRRIVELERRWKPAYLWFAIGGLLGSVIFTIVLTTGYLSRLTTTSGAVITPVLTVIQGSTVTPDQPTQIAITHTPPSTQQPTVLPSAEGSFHIGTLVMVQGTGGDGLRMRVQPGLSAAVSFVALENEVFQVEGGPTDMDGYVWWYLVNPYDPTKNGWAAMTFLRSIDSP
jgi:hypothetical protein